MNKGNTAADNTIYYPVSFDNDVLLILFGDLDISTDVVSHAVGYCNTRLTLESFYLNSYQIDDNTTDNLYGFYIGY